MYLCIDFGGTKTLVCTLDEEGKITHEVRFETPADYPDFITRLTQEIQALPERYSTGVMSVPGLIDQMTGTVIALGNRPWTNFTLKQDVLDRTGVVLTLMNDARLAGLAEAIMVRDQFSRVLYLTVSTGIGMALTIDGKLVRKLDTVEAGKMPLTFDGKLQAWEEFASGRAIYAAYGQRASDITDDNIWREVAQKLYLGVAPLCAVFQPEAIVFGGGAGMHGDRFIPHLEAAMERDTLHRIVQRPKAYLVTKLKDEAVIYGCYHFAKVHGA